MLLCIYMAICTCRSGSHCLFHIFQRDCSTSPPNVGVFSSNTPIVDYFLGTGLMETFLWTVGSFYVFGEKWDLTCFLPLRFHFFEKTHISIFIVYLQRSIMPKLGKAFIVLRFPFGKGSYLLEIPILQI